MAGGIDKGGPGGVCWVLGVPLSAWTHAISVMLPVQKEEVCMHIKVMM